MVLASPCLSLFHFDIMTFCSMLLANGKRSPLSPCRVVFHCVFGLLYPFVSGRTFGLFVFSIVNSVALNIEAQESLHQIDFVSFAVYWSFD